MDQHYYCLKSYVETRISTNRNLSDDIKNYSAPITLAYDDHNGRFLVSSREIAKGEVIFWENAVVLAPQCGVGPSCLDCFQLFSEEDWPHCKGCGLPRCFPVCDGGQHSQEECRLFSQVNEINKEDVDIVKQINIVLTPIRAWFQIEANNDIFNSLANNVAKRKSSSIGIFVERYIVKFILENLGRENIPVDFIRKICGMFDTNAFEVSVGNNKARALLPAAGLMNHSCSSNTQHWFQNGQIILRASVNIKCGQPITNNYTQVMWPTSTRRRHLSATKYFWCDCPRCEDDTEFGTHLSNPACKSCKNGILKQITDVHWQCLNCNGKLSNQQVITWISVASSVAANAATMDSDSLLRAINTFENSIGSHHYITLELKLSYIKSMASDTTESMENLMKVIFMCNFLLGILENISPGYTRLRGLVLLYKSKIFVELLLKLNEKSDLDDFPELKDFMENSFQKLVEDCAECVIILKYDTEAESSKNIYTQLNCLRNEYHV